MALESFTGKLPSASTDVVLVMARMSGSQFQHADQYTIKLEGSELVGYQSVLLGSTRDPFIIRQVDSWLDRLRAAIDTRAKNILGSETTYDLTIHTYGKNGTMGDREPETHLAHELFFLFKVTADEQSTATSIAKMAGHVALHLPIPEWSGLITGLALATTPPNFDRGPVYRFNINHVVEVDDPLEMFRIEHRHVSADQGVALA